MVRKLTLISIFSTIILLITSCSVKNLNLPKTEDTNKNNNQVSTASATLYGLAFYGTEAGNELLLVKNGEAKLIDICEGDIAISGMVGPQKCSSNPTYITNVDDVLFFGASLKAAPAISANAVSKYSYLMRLNQDESIDIFSDVKAPSSTPVVHKGYLYFPSQLNQAVVSIQLETDVNLITKLFRIKSNGDAAELLHTPDLTGNLASPNIYGLFIKDNVLYFMQQLYSIDESAYQTNLCRIKLDAVLKSADCSGKLERYVNPETKVNIVTEPKGGAVTYFDNALFIMTNDSGQIFRIDLPALNKSMSSIKTPTEITGFINATTKMMATNGVLYFKAIKDEFSGTEPFMLAVGSTEAQLIDLGEETLGELYVAGDIAYVTTKTGKLAQIDKEDLSLIAVINYTPDDIAKIISTDDGLTFATYDLDLLDTNYRIFKIPLIGGDPVEITFGEGLAPATCNISLSIANKKLFMDCANTSTNMDSFYMSGKDTKMSALKDHEGKKWEKEKFVKQK